MTTPDITLPFALWRKKEYDIAGWIRNPNSFTLSSDMKTTYFVIRVLFLDELNSSISAARPESDGSDPFYFLTAQIFYLGEPITPLLKSSITTGIKRAIFEEWFLFPISVSSLPLDSLVEFQLYCCGSHLGSVKFFPFTSRGELKFGVRRYPLTLNRDSATVTSHRLNEKNPKPETKHCEPLARKLFGGRMEAIPWLDSITEKRLASLATEPEQSVYSNGTRSTFIDKTVSELHSKTVPLSGIDSGPDARVKDDTSPLPLARSLEPTLVISIPASSNRLPVLFLASNPSNTDSRPLPLSAFHASPFHPYSDFLRQDENICETMASVFSKSLAATRPGCATTPGLQERAMLSRIAQRPLIQLEKQPLEETILLWRFRFYLFRDAHFFVPFMRSVNWANENEQNEAYRLIPLWKPPSFTDVLVCLSYFFKDVQKIREYAVWLLDRETDKIICDFALQLVQAMRYDSPELELARYLFHRSLQNWELSSKLFWYIRMEAQLELIASVDAHGDTANVSPVGSRLNSITPPSQLQSCYQNLFRLFKEYLNSKQPIFVHYLKKQQHLEKSMATLYQNLTKSDSDRLQKIQYGKRLLEEKQCGFKALFASSSTAVSTLPPTKLSGTPVPTSREIHDPSGMNSPSIPPKGEKLSPAITPISTPASIPLHQEGKIQDPLFRSCSGIEYDARSVTLPTHPSLLVTDILSESFYLFKSARMPMKIVFLTASSVSFSGTIREDSSSLCLYPLPTRPISGISSSLSNHNSEAHKGTKEQTEEVLHSVKQDSVTPSGTSEPSTLFSSNDASASDAHEKVGVSCDSEKISAESTPTTTRQTEMLFKMGDDLRQDQLVVQMIYFIDQLLKKEGLDLCLSPYRVLATSPTRGFVELVPEAETFQNVKRDALKYLQKYNSTPALLRAAMSRFTKSFAGYCVITFILGIGDRHLENILLIRDGRLLHIDFGYILGNDPKPFPPPMKINREMIELLGGPQSERFLEFKAYCCSSYNIIRKHSSVLTTVLLLMIESSIPQISGEGNLDPRVNLMKVQEKLRLDLSNAEASQYIQNVIADSVGSVFTNLWDVIHTAAQATRV